MGPGLVALLLACGPVGKLIRPPGVAVEGPAVEDALVRARVMEGWARRAAGDPIGARKAFDEAVRLDPTSVEARLARGRFVGRLDPATARADFQAALEQDPDIAGAWGGLAALGDDGAAARARELGDPGAWTRGWDGSAAYAAAWAKIALTDRRAFLARAKARAQVGDHEGATADALEALSAAPEGASAVLAGSAVEARRVGPALDALLAIHPTGEIARTALVTLARAADDPVRTLAALPSFPEPDGPDDPRLLLEVDALRRVGRFDDAIARADAVLAQKPGWAEMIRRKAQALVDAGRPRAAADLLEQPVIGAWAPAHTLMRARALIKAGRGEDALKAVEADQWRDNDSAPMAYALVIAGAAGGSQDAMLRGAIRLSPGTRADAFAEAGLVDRAVAELSADDPIQAEKAAKLLLDAGRKEEALLRIDAALLRWPERARLWSLSGRARERASDHAEARRLDPLDADSLLWYARRGDATIVPDLERALEADPGNPSLWMARGALHAAEGRPLFAVVAYEQALARAPTDPALRETLAALYSSLGDASRAEELRKKIGVEEEKPRARNSRVPSRKSSRKSRRKRRRRR